jgi:hypothetical protein
MLRGRIGESRAYSSSACASQPAVRAIADELSLLYPGLLS